MAARHIGFKRVVASTLVGALFFLTPGFPAYQALAANATGGGPKGPSGTTGPVAEVPKISAVSLPVSAVPGAPAVAVPGALITSGTTPEVSGTAETPLLPASAAMATDGAVALPAANKDFKHEAKVILSPELQAEADAQAAAKPKPGAKPAPVARSAKKAAAQAIAPVAEAAKQLADAKSDKSWTLANLFDRLRRRGASDAAPAVAAPAATASAKPALAASTKPAAAPAASVPAPAAAKSAPVAKPARFAKLKAAFDLSQFNKSEKGYLLGQTLLILSLSVYLASLPLMAVALTGEAAMAGIARGVHYWTFAGASLFSGAVVQRLAMKRTLVGATILRAAVFGAIGVLAMTGALPWGMFLGLVAVNALVVSMNHLVDLTGGGARKVFDSKEKIENAVYLRKFIWNAMMLFVPAVMGLGLDALSQALGPGVAAGIGYSLFGILMGSVAWVYAKRVVVLKAKEAVKEKLSLSALAAGAKAVVATRAGKVGLTLMGAGAAAAGLGFVFGATAAIAGAALGAAGLMIALNWEAMTALWANKTLLVRSGLATLENFVEDSLMTVIVPAVAFATAGGNGNLRNGVLLSAGTLAGLFVSKFLYSRAQKVEAKIGPSRFMTRLTWVAALGFVPSLLLWGATPPLAFAFAAFLLMELMYLPIKTRMEALLQTTIDADPRAAAASEKIFSLMNFVETFAAGAGAVAFGWLFKHAGDGTPNAILGPSTPMKVVTLSLILISAAYMLSLRWIKAGLGRTERKVHAGRGTMSQAFAKARELAASGAAEAADKLSGVQKSLLRHSEGAPSRIGALKLYLEASDLVAKSDKAAGAKLDALQDMVAAVSEKTADSLEEAKLYAASGLFAQAGGVLEAIAEELSPLEAAALSIERAKADLYAGRKDEAVKALDALALPKLEEALALSRLSESLKRMGLDPAEQVSVEEAVSADRPTTVILSPASVYKLSIAQEGGRQAPGDLHLALDPSWLIQEVGHDGKAKLFLTKGVTFGADGKARVVTYKVPRRVRYFANFYTMGGNDRDDGVVLEKNLDVPQSNSLQLEKITNDKLLTRLMLAAKGVAVPATVAFLMAAHPLKAKAAEMNASGTGVHAAALPESRAEIKGRIEEFLKHYSGEGIVIKPSGPQYHSARGVKFFGRGELELMVDHVVALSKDEMMTQDGAILVDERLEPPAVYLRTSGDTAGGTMGFLPELIPMRMLRKSEIAAARPKEKKDWNLRVIAARAPWGGGVTGGSFSRANAWGTPTTAEPENPEDAASILKLDDIIFALREQHGLLKTAAEEDAFRQDLKTLGAKALEALAESEKGRARADGEPYQAQTDMIGLDVMVVLENGRLVPKIIEVNDHDSGGQWQFDRFHPEDAGALSRAWVATMLARARRDAMKGKRVVLVGAGYPNKRFFLEKAKELGVEVVLVDKGLSGGKRFLSKVLGLFGSGLEDNWARDLVSEFIAVDTGKPEEAIAEARKKLQRSARKNGRLDGITTFWEDDVVLTARIAKDLGLRYHGVEASKIARNKFETRRAMDAAGLPSAESRLITTREDLVRALARGFPFPAVLKPARGAEAMLTVRVNDADEALARYDQIASKVNTGMDAIYKEGTEVVLDQYLLGREWDADIVLQGGRVVYSSVTDNWPTREPYFVATGSSLPSRSLTREEQGEVVDYSAKSLAALGFTDGVYHMEGKYQSGKGPRLIEANVRPGGSYVVPWNAAVNGVDLSEILYAEAAGIPLSVYKAEEPLAFLEGEFIMSDRSGKLKEMRVPEEVKEDPIFHELVPTKAIGARLEAPFKARAGLLTARGASSREAQKNLEKLKASLILDIEYDPDAPASGGGK